MSNDYKNYEPLFGEWYINCLIGEGAFAKVYQIERKDITGEYKSALKVITIPCNKSEISLYKTEGMSDGEIRKELKQSTKNLLKEITVMYKLKGKSNIVSYEDHMVIEHTNSIGWDILIRMELLTPLTDYMQNKTITRNDVIKIGIDICKALELCGKYNIIHRDIKPDNIFMSKDGDFKLGDFGIAREIENTTSGLSKKGTYTYMAPEVYRGLKYNSSVDIYSVGMVLYRLLNYNRAPFMPSYPDTVSYSDRERAMERRMNGEKLPPPQSIVHSDELNDIIMKACAYRPEDRYKSPQQFKEDLLKAMQNQNSELIIDKTVSINNLDYISEEEDSEYTEIMDIPKDIKKIKRKPFKFIALTAAICVIAAAVIMIASSYSEKSENDISLSENMVISRDVYNTSTRVYINNVPIPSYMISNKVVVRAEDLREYGFDVIYQNDEMKIKRNKDYHDIIPHIFEMNSVQGLYANASENNIPT